MANKENLSPHAATTRYLPHDSSKAPINAWSQTQSTAKTPLFGLSPSKNPVLSQQRDHSACRRTDSPLKVRKTRENLRQPTVYNDVPHPCVHGAHAAAKITEDNLSDHLDTSGSTLVNTHEDEYPTMRPLTPVAAPGRMQRHKSVSRRMLSRVKEGISHRSRSSQSMRGPQEFDASLTRKFSGKGKQSSEEQPRLRSFEVSRNSIDSFVDGTRSAAEAESSYRSFTDCSVSTASTTGSTTSVSTPPQSRPATPATTTHTRQYSGRLLSPSPRARSPTGDPTPKAALKSVAFGLGAGCLNLQATIPFVDLSILVDRDSVDVDLTKDLWVAVEGTVQSRVPEAFNAQSALTLPQLRKRSLDAIIIVTQDILEVEKKAAHKCIVELCSRLNVAGDRLAVLCARVQQTGTSTVNCECEQLHPLQSPKLTRLFERLGIAPSTVNTIFEEHWQSLPDSLQTFTEQGIRKDRVHTFIISKTPDLLVEIIDKLVQWPAHALKIGLAVERASAPTPRTRHNWAVQMRGEGDDNVSLYDNMVRDLRHGHPMGAIPSLRMCYKPMQGCKIMEVLGQKALKDVRLGQRCSLFLKVQVPRINTARPSPQNDTGDTDSLFAELESIVGTLETNLIQVEARYRHSMLPLDNVVTVRQVCNIRRPKSDSRWSIVGTEPDTSRMDQVPVKLAQFLAMNYPPAKALRMIDRWAVQPHTPRSEALQRIRKHLHAEISSMDRSYDRSMSASPGSEKPSVVVTDIDSEPHSTASSSVTGTKPSIYGQPAPSLALTQRGGAMNLTSPNGNIAAARTISAPTTTTAVTLSDISQTDQSLNEGEDTARVLWRHIRHHSLSAKQLADMTPTKLQQLEASDENIRTLRHRALSNKRSVGAETLMGWKYEERLNDSRAEAPWL